MIYKEISPEEITFKDILDIYEKYCFKHGLSPQNHLTHILLVICQLAEASLMLGKSKDAITDKVADVVQSVCKFYQQLDVYATKYSDKSMPMLLRKEKEPLLFISLIADAIIHLLIYVCGNGWKDSFLEIIKTKCVNDDASDVSDICRFMCNRIGWKLEQKIIEEGDLDEDLQ